MLLRNHKAVHPEDFPVSENIKLWHYTTSDCYSVTQNYNEINREVTTIVVFEPILDLDRS